MGQGAEENLQPQPLSSAPSPLPPSARERREPLSLDAAVLLAGRDVLELLRRAAGPGHDDTLDGVSGNDQVIGFGGNDTMDGGSGNDFMAGGPLDDEMQGGSGNDDMFGNFGSDTMFGGSGNDLVDGDNNNPVPPELPFPPGTNNDACTGNSGVNTVQNCEVLL